MIFRCCFVDLCQQDLFVQVGDNLVHGVVEALATYWCRMSWSHCCFHMPLQLSEYSWWLNFSGLL